MTHRDISIQISEKRLSKFNHSVNGMSGEQLEEALRTRQLSDKYQWTPRIDFCSFLVCRGEEAILRARLKNHHKAQLMFGCENPLAMIEQEFRFIAVIDFEATCERQSDGSYPNEIIEFPVVLIDTEKQTIVSHLSNDTLSHSLTMFAFLSLTPFRSIDFNPTVVQR